MAQPRDDGVALRLFSDWGSPVAAADGEAQSRPGHGRPVEAILPYHIDESAGWQHSGGGMNNDDEDDDDALTHASYSVCSRTPLASERI